MIKELTIFNTPITVSLAFITSLFIFGCLFGFFIPIALQAGEIIVNQTDNKTLTNCSDTLPEDVSIFPSYSGAPSRVIVGFLNNTSVTNKSIVNIEWFSFSPETGNGSETEVGDKGGQVNVTMTELYVNGELVQRKSEEGFYSFQASRELKEGENVISILARDSLENTNSTSFNFTLDTQGPTIEVLPAVYPRGVNSARPGDEVILMFKIDDSGTGIDSVEIKSTGAVPIGNSEFYRYAWNSKDANYLFKVSIPEEQLPGNYSLNITAMDKAGNKAYRLSNVTVKLAYTSFNLELLPGWNIISLPLIPDDKNPDSFFDFDIIERVWAYDSTSKDWEVYTPGPAPDTLKELKTGTGYIILTNSSRFNTIKVSETNETVSIPVKINYSGKYLQPGQVPPTYSVKKGWNLIGFHSEETMSAGEYLAGLTYPERTWTSLLTYNNNEVVGIDIEKLEEVGNSIGYWSADSGIGGENSFNICRLNLNDYMQLGKGYWVFVSEDGVITP